MMDIFLLINRWSRSRTFRAAPQHCLLFLEKFELCIMVFFMMKISSVADPE